MNIICPHCQKEFSSRGISAHKRIVHDGFRLSDKNGIWNKNKTKETDSRILIASKKISESLTGRVGKSHSDESKANLSKHAIKNGFGGVTNSRKILYNGKSLGSCYELLVAKSLDENSIKWETCSRIKYIDPNGKIRTYTPDFYLPDLNVYLDPKNDFLINNINPGLGFKDIDKIKLVEQQNNIKILILSKLELSWDKIKEKIMLL